MCFSSYVVVRYVRYVEAPRSRQTGRSPCLCVWRVTCVRAGQCDALRRIARRHDRRIDRRAAYERQQTHPCTTVRSLVWLVADCAKVVVGVQLVKQNSHVLLLLLLLLVLVVMLVLVLLLVAERLSHFACDGETISLPLLVERVVHCLHAGRSQQLLPEQPGVSQCGGSTV